MRYYSYFSGGCNGLVGIGIYMATNNLWLTLAATAFTLMVAVGLTLLSQK